VLAKFCADTWIDLLRRYAIIVIRFRLRNPSCHRFDVRERDILLCISRSAHSSQHRGEDSVLDFILRELGGGKRSPRLGQLLVELIPLRGQRRYIVIRKRMTIRINTAINELLLIVGVLRPSLLGVFGSCGFLARLFSLG
jgi:hypothetical protein